MPNTPATGTGPFEFTDSQDKQVSIPLTAFSFDSTSKLIIDPSWQAVTGAQPAAALLAYALAEKLIKPAAAPSPFPAMILKAADPGWGGNYITVTISNVVPDAASPPSNDPTQATFNITVTETDIYSGLTAATIESVLGSSAVTGSSPALVRVLAGSVDPSGVPSVTSGVLSGSPPHLDVDGTGSPPRVFTLIAKKAGVDSTLTHVQVTPNTSSPPTTPETFTLQASWTKPPVTVTLATLQAEVSSQLGYEITVSLPASGAYSLPAAAATTLSGGAPGVNASATLFTGI
jgi:hypothetical protein